MNTELYVEPYFSVRLDPGRKAGDVFQDAKAASIRNLRRQIEAIESLTFDRYAARCLTQEWTEDTIYGAPE